MKHFFLIILLGLSLSQGVCFAQSESNDLFDLTFEELLNMEVTTVSKKAEKLLETPSVVNVLTAKEIHSLNFNTLEEILGYVAGISSVTAEGNVFTTSTIRGNTLTNYNSNTLLMFNGVPIYNAYHGSFNLNTIPLSSIERVEVVKGSNSVLYGTNAINAVINIIPKRNKTGEEKSSTMAVKYGSFNTGKVSASHHINKDDLAVNLYGDGLYTSGQDLKYHSENDGSPLGIQKKFSSINVATIIDYKAFNFTFQFNNSNQNNLDENSLFPVFFPEGVDTFTHFWPQRTEEYQLVASLGYNKEISKLLSLSIRSTYQDWQMDKDEWSGKKIYSSWGSFNDVELNFNPTHVWNNKLGVSYNHYLGSRDRSRIKNNEAQFFSDVEPSKKATQDVAVYFNGNYKFSKKFNFHYGGRYYSSSYDGVSNDNFSPRLSLVYGLRDNIKVKAIYGSSFRVPTYFEKGSRIKSIYGNSELNPETSTSYDFVIFGTSKRVSWDVNLFMTEIDNKIVRVTPNAQDEEHLGFMPKRMFKNTGSYSFIGLESNAKFNFNDKLYGFVNYSYVEAENNEDNPDLIGDDPWYYNHMAAAGVSFRPVHFMEVTASSKYLSKWGFGKVSGVEYAAADPSVIVNMGLNIYPLKDEKLSFELKVDNILDEDIYVPEIAGRNIDTAPVVPYNIGIKGFVGISYRF